MITEIRDGHVVDRPARPMTPWDAAIARTLLREVHRIEIDVRTCAEKRGEVVHLAPSRRLSTAEEVLVLRAFAAVTDSPLAWHGDVVWTATRCDRCGQYLCCCLGGAR